MSGKTQSTIYRIFIITFALLALAGTVLLAYPYLTARDRTANLWVCGGAILLFLFFPLNSFVHECGHLLFGWAVGMKFASVRFGKIRIYKQGKRTRITWLKRGEVAGSCEMYPKNGKRIRGKTVLFALGGALLNFAFGIAFLCTFFLCERHSALLFFQIFAPLNLYEGLCALFPVLTETGYTDGATAWGLLKGEPSALLTQRVLTVQGLLSQNGFERVERDLLFSTPVVQEDELAFLALTQLRYQYLFYMGEEESATAQLARMEELYEYLPEYNRAEVACDFVYYYTVVSPDQDRAKSYVGDCQDAEGSVAYLRATCALAPSPEGIERLQEAVKGEQIVGIALLEEKYLRRMLK